MRCDKCPYLTSDPAKMAAHNAERHKKPVEEDMDYDEMDDEDSAEKDSAKEDMDYDEMDDEDSAEKDSGVEDSADDEEEAATTYWQEKLNLAGVCLLCGMEAPHLPRHHTTFHSGRCHTCPFCATEMTNLGVYWTHLQKRHPYQIGIKPGKNGKLPPLKHNYSGRTLLKIMEYFDQDITDAVPYKFFAVSYDNANRCHRWVVFEVTKALVDSAAKTKRPPCVYERCPRIGGDQPISHSIAGVGCHHGHAAPRYLYKGDPQAFRESCLFPNISAQRKGFNTGGSRMWEINERNLATHNDSIIVITGPTYSPDPEAGWENAGCGYRHRLPEGFFRFLIICNRGQPDRFQAFFYLNQPNREKIYQERYSIEDLQARLDWEFLPGLRNLSYTWSVTDETQYINCEICKETIPKADFVDYQAAHGYLCRKPGCGRIFKSRQALRTHNRSHRKGLFKCGICSEEFASQSRLNDHLLRHANQYDFPCVFPGCKERFNTDTGRQSHYKHVHAIIKEYYCPIDGCDFGTGDRTSWKKHLISAHSDFCFVCPTCLAAYRRKHSLQRHRLKDHEIPSANDNAVKSQTDDRAFQKFLSARGVTIGQLKNLSDDIRRRKEQEAEDEEN